MTAMLLLGIFAGDPLAESMSKVVKLYGAGAGRVEGYGTGILIDGNGGIVTSLSGMLQGETITAVLSDGRRRSAKVVAADPTAGLALLSTEGWQTPFFDLKSGALPEVGQVVYALSNQFNVAAGDEPVSVQRGILAGRTKLVGRIGVRDAPTSDEVLLVDAAASNPGAAGGALVNSRGELVGLIGRELRNAATDTWIHYAVPASAVERFRVESRSGKQTSSMPANLPIASASVDLRGIIPLPDWLDRTPPYVDSLTPGSPAAEAGLKSDDLVMFIDGRLVGSVAEMQSAFSAAPPEKPLKLTVKRGGGLVTLELKPSKK